jgi:hypothetical protein
MPVFDYLSQNEAADVYLYLTLYPPSETGIGNLGRASPQPTQAAAGTLLTSSNAVSAPSLQNTADVFEPKQTDDWMPTLLMLGAVWFTVHLLAGGLALVLGEFRRLSAQSGHLREVVPEIRAEKDGLHHRAA